MTPGDSLNHSGDRRRGLSGGRKQGQMGAGCSGAPCRRAGGRKVAGPSGARLPGFKSSFRNIRAAGAVRMPLSLSTGPTPNGGLNSGQHLPRDAHLLSPAHTTAHIPVPELAQLSNLSSRRLYPPGHSLTPRQQSSDEGDGVASFPPGSELRTGAAQLVRLPPSSS